MKLAVQQNEHPIEPEITAKAARLGARFVELPISYQGRSYREGKKIGITDGLKAIATIIRFGLKR